MRLFFASETSDSVGFVTFVKSNAKALLTLRIKSPLRSAEGISRWGHRDSEFSLSAERRHFGLSKPKIVKHRIVFLRAHCGTQRIAHARNTLICGQYPHSLGYFPMQRALKFSSLPPPRPPFSRRRLCICGGSYHISDDTAAVFFGR